MPIAEPDIRSSFQTDARAAIEGFRTALTASLDVLGSLSRRRSVDLAAALELDTKLAWKLSRILELSDPYSAGLYIPGPGGIRILTDALQRGGVPPHRLLDIELAHEAFAQLQRTHAGDRRTLDMLLSSLAEQEQDRCDLEQRRAAHQANASLWGVHAAMRLMTFVVSASTSEPARIDVAHIAGLFGVSRTRPNVPWRVAQLRAENNTGDPAARAPSRPLDPDAPPSGPPILQAHCKGPVPELIPVPVDRGRIEYRLGDGPIGRTSEFDLVFAEFMPSAGERYRSSEDRQLSVASRNRTPAERLVLDLVLDRDLYGFVDPKALLVSELWGERSPTLLDDPERLPLTERLTRLAPGISAMVHRDVPRHAELMQRLFDACQWNPARFDTYRIDMPYPPAPTALRMVVPLPEPPAG